jgi:tRNA-specific 2-thiouridylase
MSSKLTVAVGLSGGVDSSLAAAILKNEGFDVIGLTMKIWRGAYKIQEDLKHACFGPGEEEDIASCERMCENLGIEYRVLDLSIEYEHYVIDYFKKEYSIGRTPNPCIVCNRELKFGFLLKKARDAGLRFDRFATGHYARTAKIAETTFLKVAADESKDQTYFLYGLDSARLENVMFPLGEMTKDQVRNLARSYSLEAAEKKESQDFIGGGDYTPLFEADKPEPGDIVDTQGNVLGRHRGLPFYTIGQRRGIGLSSGTSPFYVVGLDVKTNHVIVGPNSGLFATGLESGNFRFQKGVPEEGSCVQGFAKIRQNHKPVACTACVIKTGTRIDFEIAQRAVAPGQSAVLYSEGGLVLGGGIIDTAIENP